MYIIFLNITILLSFNRACDSRNFMLSPLCSIVGENTMAAWTESAKVIII